MIRLRPSGADEVLIKRVRDWYEPGPGVFIAPQALFSPALLFTTGVTGAWYDPSDRTTLFQDATGTTPVTAVEQPVGRMLDKSGRGNHAFNNSGNSANFPVLSARYNLLTKTEQFDDAAWSKVGSSVSSNTGTAPDGTQTADTVTFTGASQELAQVVTAPASNVLCGIYIKGTAGQTIKWDFAGNGQLFTLTGAWQLIQITQASAGTAASLSLNTYSGATARVLQVWGADLRVANDALNQPAYQRVNTATDYDTVGFKPYLRFNGVNQWLQTNSIDFTYGDKMFVCAGVRHLSNSNYGGLVGLGATVSTAGSFLLWTRSAAGTGGFEWYSNGNATGTITESATPTLPRTSVVSSTGDLSLIGAANELKLRLNESFATTTAAGDCGTGNYANAVITIGSYNASNFFNGRLHQLVVAGKAASASEISSTETYTNTKTGAY